MALPTYIDLVNDVLVRMREPEVTSVQENNISKLVGKHINDAKRQVENAFSWNALTSTLTVPTVSGTSNYTLTGSGQRFKILSVRNSTQSIMMKGIPLVNMKEWLDVSPVPTGASSYFCIAGVNSSTGDSKVDLYPVPDAVYSIKFETYIPQADLVNDGDTLQIPYEPVVLGAFARALVERGEDGGLNSSEAYALYRSSLADHIALESSRFAEDGSWEAN